jgi:SAM-dependent methyltransferase
MPTAECALLHRGGRRGTWGSLGLWHGDEEDYALACQALASAVGRAAGLQPGDHVLSLACGAGDELLLWLQAFGVARVTGVERDALRVQAARKLLATRLPGLAPSAATVVEGSALAMPALGLQDAQRAHQGDAAYLPQAAGVDRVVCVDGAYHLRPRSDFLRAALAALRPGGTLAYTDLSLVEQVPPWRRALLQGAARLCGLDGDELASAARQQQRLKALGFVDVQVQPLDAAVLSGFARYVRQQSDRVARTAWHPDWRRPALTARLIGPSQAAGLGYVLLSARKPFAADAQGELGAASKAASTSAPSAAATSQAERTALSSSGTPPCA